MSDTVSFILCQEISEEEHCKKQLLRRNCPSHSIGFTEERKLIESRIVGSLTTVGMGLWWDRGNPA